MPEAGVGARIFNESRLVQIGAWRLVQKARRDSPTARAARLRDQADEIRAFFDAGYYCSANPDVVSSGRDVVVHYVEHGGSEGRKPHPLFDGTYYLATYPDVAESGLNPLVHYLRIGGAEGRNPNPLFHGQWYLDTYRPIMGSETNPLLHYLGAGVEEGTNPNRIFDPPRIICRAIRMSRDLREIL